jgi:serine/threonine protein kinase
MILFKAIKNKYTLERDFMFNWFRAFTIQRILIHEFNVDFWSLDLIISEMLYEMLSDIPPFASANPRYDALKIIRRRKNFRFTWKSKINRDVIDLANQFFVLKRENWFWRN